MGTYKDTMLLDDKVSKPLKKITKEAENVTKKSETLRQKIAKLNNNMAKLQPTLNKAWGGVRKLSSAFVGLVGSSGILTMGIAKVTDFADNIDKMSQKIGMSTDEYQKWNYIMTLNGGNVDSLAIGFKTLTAQIEGVQKGSKDSIKAFSALGVRVKDNKGKFRAQTEIFNDTVRALQKIQDPTRKAILGQRLFGRSYLEMRPILNQSAEAIEELAQNFEKYGMKLSKKEIENAVKFKDTWTTFTMFLQANTNKALSSILPKLQGILEKIMKHREAIKNVIKGLGDLTLKIFDIIGFLTKHKGFLAFIVGTVTGLGAMTLWSNIVVGITSVKIALAALGVEANVMLGGIPILIGVFASTLTLLALNWDKVKETASRVGSAISSAWSSLVGKFKGWIGGIIEWIDKLLEKLGFLAYLIPGLGQIKLGKDIAGAISSRINNNSVRQTANTTTNNTTTTNNNYYGNTYNTGGFTPLVSAAYSL